MFLLLILLLLALLFAVQGSLLMVEPEASALPVIDPVVAAPSQLVVSV